MDGFRPELQTCPWCGTKGSCRIHAYYDRSLVDFMGGAPVRHSLCILRLICSCDHTHAILPDDMSCAFILYEGEHYPIRPTDKNENCRTKRSNTPGIDYSKLGGGC